MLQMIKYRVGGFLRSSKRKEKTCITCKAFQFPKSDGCAVFFETTDYFLGRLSKMMSFRMSVTSLLMFMFV